MIPGTYITDQRLKVVRNLPWVIPASVLMCMTDEDLDNLGAAPPEEYWSTLNDTVERIQGTGRLYE